MIRAHYAGFSILMLGLFLCTNYESRPQANQIFDSYPNKLLIDLHFPSDGRDFEFVRHSSSGSIRSRQDSFTIWSQKFDSVLEYRSYKDDERTLCSEKRYPTKSFNADTAFKNYPAHKCNDKQIVAVHEDLGILRRLAIYDRDGQSFIKHEVRRKDGSLERSGERQRDGRYHIRYYYADGITLHRERYFIRKNEILKLDPLYTDPLFSANYQKKQFKLSFERVYRKDGLTPESQIVLVEGSYAKSLFNEQGERVATINQDDGIYKNGDIFSSDGKTLLASYTYSPWMSEEQYFRPDGTLLESRLMYMNSTEARFFDLSGKQVIYKQVWRDRPQTASSPARSILSRLHIYDDASGKEIIVRMTNDGSAVNEVSYSDLSQPNSSLVSIANSIDSTRFEKSQRIQINTQMFQNSSDPAWIYDYEDNLYPVVEKPTPGVLSE